MNTDYIDNVKQLVLLAELDKEISMWNKKLESHKRNNPTCIPHSSLDEFTRNRTWITS